MSVQICEDGHRCLNGSMCTENPNDEGSFYCDCDEIIDSVYAGIHCEHKATSFCTSSGEVSRTSFCTNEGTCSVKTGDPIRGPYIACKCKAGYEGDHCQFNGAKQREFYENSLSQPAPVPHNPSSGGSGGLVVVLVLLFLGIIGGAGFFIYRKKKALSTPLDTNKASSSADLALEADGGVLQDSMRNLETLDESDHMNGSGHHAPSVATKEESDLEENNIGNDAGEDIDPKEMEDIQISNSNEII
mmetsp:Transcript_9945/g.15289  ORF Transcript_9945/g.15289 Transcript_9945/m.15289 type:complete len:245 (-) Transcript_9945:78-812(-)